MVNGPGQKASAKRSTVSGISSTIGFNASIEHICTINGLSDGLPFAAYIFLEDSLFRASPPNPYTVSVGNATKPPFLIMVPASCKTASSIALWSMVITFVSIIFIILSLHDIVTLIIECTTKPFFSKVICDSTQGKSTEFLCFCAFSHLIFIFQLHNDHMHSLPLSLDRYILLEYFFHNFYEHVHE